MTPSGLLGNKTLRTLLKVINHLPGRYILVHQFKWALAVTAVVRPVAEN